MFVSGNVVQQRLSLEIKNLDLSNGVNENNVLKIANESETKTFTELLEDKKSVPPTLPKKPLVPSKKTGNVTSVAGNIISGIKKSVKSVEQKLQISSSNHDTSDGVSSSKIEIADNFNKNCKVNKYKHDEDFDDVERTTTMLQDVRVGRVKAPKRRPPTSNTAPGNENNNYINVISYNENVEVIRSQVYIKTEKEENNRISKNIPAKINAPWMAELMANQERKKTPLKRENISNNISTSETSSSRSVYVKNNIITSETTSSIAVQTPDNPELPKLPIVEKHKEKSAVSMPSKPNISSVQKEDMHICNNSLVRNNNTIDSSSVASHITGTSKIIELEKRVQTLECIVEQLRQELLFIRNVNENSIDKVVKSEVEKYV